MDDNKRDGEELIGGVEENTDSPAENEAEDTAADYLHGNIENVEIG